MVIEALKKGIPVPVSERPKPLTVKRCVRCNEDEFRIDGFCSVYCRNMDELEREIVRLREKNGNLRDWIDRMLSWSITNRGTKHQFVTCRTDVKLHNWPEILDEGEALLRQGQS